MPELIVWLSGIKYYYIPYYMWVVGLEQALYIFRYGIQNSNTLYKVLTILCEKTRPQQQQPNMLDARQQRTYGVDRSASLGPASLRVHRAAF